MNDFDLFVRQVREYVADTDDNSIFRQFRDMDDTELAIWLFDVQLEEYTLTAFYNLWVEVVFLKLKEMGKDVELTDLGEGRVGIKTK